MHQSSEICPSPATQWAAVVVVAPAAQAGGAQTHNPADQELFDHAVQASKNARALREQARHPACTNPRQAIEDAKWYEGEVRALADWAML
mgnify:CR=1 FL=1